MKKLYKAENGKILAGVCQGISEYLNIDPTVVRLIWILFTACYGAGIVAYIICALIFPSKNNVIK